MKNRRVPKTAKPESVATTGIERLRRVLLIALIVTSILVLAAVVVTLVVAFTTANTSSDTSGVELPYNAQSRPLPDPKNAGNDLPRTVGRYTQTALTGRLNGLIGQLNATYTNGNDKVQIEIELDANNAQAYTEFQARLGTIKSATLDTQEGLGYGYIKGVDPATKAARVVYLKQFWLIDVTANSQAALDAFMLAYPY